MCFRKELSVSENFRTLFIVIYFVKNGINTKMFSRFYFIDKRMLIKNYRLYNFGIHTMYYVYDFQGDIYINNVNKISFT